MRRISPKIILIISCIAICVFATYRCVMRLHAVEQYVAHFDEVLSEQVRQEISAHLPAQIGNSPTTTIATLLDVFGCIESASISIEPNKDGIIDIVAQKPLVIINENYVLSEHARILPLDYYETKVCAQLASLHVESDVFNDIHELEIMAREIKGIDPALLKRFDITWSNHHEVIVRDVQNPCIAMICCSYQLSDATQVESNLKQIAHIIEARQNDLTTNSKTGKAAGKPLIADIRFENQIIMRCNAMNGVGKIANGAKGGIQHGTFVS